MRYHVTQTVSIEAESAEAAAVEFDRLALTTKPKELNVTPEGGRNATVFIRVTRGEAARVA
jgi:hypothetical protein